MWVGRTPRPARSGAEIRPVTVRVEGPESDKYTHGLTHSTKPGVADELVGAQDVAVVRGVDARDRSDEPPVVGAVDEEPDVVAHDGPVLRLKSGLGP